ncbi:hypothetical protein OU798_15070 [Prolixibacteraceae bacterium Z1-6]|uniref:DUF481 domain-containing protein n=1 Tax=Draconibacterium aestuarii TaxID=2998507 RepID=A0A9X3F7C3_9BACT|nr:hypothetical protein [Prolixibacteraceae bacterium Z1-6]
MKRIYPFFAFLFISYFSFGQYENFDLSKYKLPDIKRHKLDFIFNSQGQFSHDYIVHDNEYLRDTTDERNNQFNGKLNLLYSYYKNTNRMQSSAFFSFSTGYRKNEQKGRAENDYMNKYGETDMSGSYQLNYFLNDENWFIRGVPNATFSYLNISNGDNERKLLFTSESFLLGIGKGRVEQVQDFRHAILILQDLDKRGLTKKELSEDEIIELASLISRLKNERFFDSRIKMETDLEQIDSLLNAINVIDIDDIKYFTSLNDMWRYGDLYVRESGNKIGLSIEPGYSFRNRDLNNDYSEEDMIEEDFTVEYDLRFSSYNPISIKWQADYFVGLNHFYTNELQDVYNGPTQKNYLSSVYLSGNFGYFPNTRTYLSLNSHVIMQNQSYSEDKKIDKDKYELKCLLFFNAYYYISDRLRLNGSFSTQNNFAGLFNSKWGHARTNQYNYNLTLNYAIF